MLISLDLRLTHFSQVLGAVRIALERVEVRRSVPRTSIHVLRKAVSIVNMLRTCLDI